jgi:hypothetical protein
VIRYETDALPRKHRRKTISELVGTKPNVNLRGGRHGDDGDGKRAECSTKLSHGCSTVGVDTAGRDMRV